MEFWGESIHNTEGFYGLDIFLKNTFFVTWSISEIEISETTKDWGVLILLLKEFILKPF